jgi:hypothetical protein
LPQTFLQRHRTLGERQRLIVAVAEEGHVRLIDADDRNRIVGAERRRLPLGQPQCGRRFVVAAVLRQHHAGKRVDEREMAAIAGGVKRRGGFGNVLADDGRIAHLGITERQLVMREADGARIVRRLRLLERSAMQRDGARLFAAGVRDAAVQPPERREQHRRNRLADRVGRPAKGCAGLRDLALQQKRLGQRAPHDKLVGFLESTLKQWRQNIGCSRRVPTLQVGAGAGHHRLQGRADHGSVVYQVST